jgi:potassium channel subfamily V protein 2
MLKPASTKLDTLNLIHDINKKRRIILNVRGVKYEVLLSILIKYPKTRLGRLSTLLLSNQKPSQQELNQLCDDYKLNENEFYFNKDPYILNMVLNYFSGYDMGYKIHLYENVCFKYLNEQLSYWGIDYESTVDKCCKISLSTRKEFLIQELEKEEAIIRDLEFRYDFGNRLFSRLREKLFNYIEKPMESTAGIVN